MEMTGLQIFKFLPAAKKEEHSNCKECGCPTCMAFALKLAKKNIDIEKCPYIKDELKEKYAHSVKHAQETVEFCGLKIGGENVLYRHEKTFINRTVFAVLVDCANRDYLEKINRINAFEIKGVNENFKVDLIILKNFNGENIHSTVSTITQEEFEDLPITNIIDSEFQNTKNSLLTTRQKAILEKDEKFSSPMCVWITKNDDLINICARASYYICKYANMIVFEDFDESLFSTIVRLRQNIYTDPQKPLQVESDLYKFNNPNENSIIFLTTNFALTFFAVANELESLNIPSYLIVIPADGMSVLTAWSAEKFTANIVSKTLEKLNIRKQIKTRQIIIPGLLAHTKDELQEIIPDFDFVIGTIEASAIREFVKNLE
jgi:CO dehydrogenase/acetyl-coA synthase delta subunit